MMGSGIPINQSSAPLPIPIELSFGIELALVTPGEKEGS